MRVVVKSAFENLIRHVNLFSISDEFNVEYIHLYVFYYVSFFQWRTKRKLEKIRTYFCKCRQRWTEKQGIYFSYIHIKKGCSDREPERHTTYFLQLVKKSRQVGRQTDRQGRCTHFPQACREKALLLSIDVKTSTVTDGSGASTSV